jgi:hypothetical protein
MSRKQRKSASGHSAAWDAAEYTNLLAILQQELRGHYELPHDLPHKILTLMMTLNDQGSKPTTPPGKTINREHLFHAVYENVGLRSNQLIALERSEYWSESNIHHVWRCPKCDFRFKTTANNKSVVMTGNDILCPSQP